MHKHSSRHRRHVVRMGRRAMRRGRGPGFGPSGARRGLLHGFLTENPDVAERLARYGVAQLRAEGYEDDEIRDHIAHMSERGLLGDLDVADLLS